jgi:hypothetical protein
VPIPKINVPKAHAYFAPSCFNAAWDLIRKQRSASEDRAMLHVAHASLWHWSQRKECTDRHRSIAYWLLARVYALAGQPEPARAYGELALEFARKESPFYPGFAHEALARAAAVAGKAAAVKKHLRAAEAFAAQVSDAAEAAWLRENLATIQVKPARKKR